MEENGPALLAGVIWESIRNKFSTLLDEKLDEKLRKLANDTGDSEVKEKLLTTKQACELLGVSKATLHRWKRNGWLHPKRISKTSRRVYYDLAEIQKTLKQNQN